MSALSNIVTPASRQISTNRRASATSVVPHALKNSPLPPKVPVPKLSTGTVKPDAPKRRYSIANILSVDGGTGRKRPQPQVITRQASNTSRFGVVLENRARNKAIRAGRTGQIAACPKPACVVSRVARGKACLEMWQGSALG